MDRNWVRTDCGFLVALLLLGCGLAAAPSPVAGGPAEPSRPESIDPRAPGVLDFLDTDLAAAERMAENAHREGRYEEAARLYLFVLRHRASEPRVLYNLACAYGRLGDGKRAATLLRHAFDAGFSDFAAVQKDEDFRPVYADFFFTQVLGEARSREALAGERMLVPARSLVPARIHLPRGHDPGKASTLLIGLHGFGATCENLAPIWGYLENPRFIFVAPESPYPRPPSLDTAQPGFTWGFPTRDKAVWAIADPMVGENMASVAEAIAKTHKVGDVYLLGHSQGGSFAAMAGIENFQAFKGVIVLAGTFPADLVTGTKLAAAAGKVRFFLAYGNRDQAVDVSEGRRFRDRLTEAGIDVTYVEHDGDHRIAPEVLRKAVEWMNTPPAPPTAR